MGHQGIVVKLEQIPNRTCARRTKWKVYSRVGHLVQQCYYRFDPSFQGLSSFLNGFLSAQDSSSMTTMVATTPKFAYDFSYYPNSRATNHITLDIHNLMNKIEFARQDKIVMGNGTGWNIKHIGQSSFQSQFTSKLLSLNHLRHVPSITKNLLSVSKFAKDNVVYEFFLNFCYVKD